MAEYETNRAQRIRRIKAKHATKKKKGKAVFELTPEEKREYQKFLQRTLKKKL